MCYFVHLLYVNQPTLQSVGDESVGLLTFCHSSAGAAVSLSYGAYDWPRPSSSFGVKRGIGRGQEAGGVWICRTGMMDGAVSSEAVCVRLA